MNTNINSYNTIIGSSTYTINMDENMIPIGYLNNNYDVPGITYSNIHLNDNYYHTGNIAIGLNAIATGVSSIAIGANAFTPAKRVKPCHKDCKVTWTRIHDEPIIECQVHLQLAVWESFWQHPMYRPSKLPRDLFRLIADLIKDQEKGDYINVTLT